MVRINTESQPINKLVKIINMKNIGLDQVIGPDNNESFTPGSIFAEYPYLPGNFIFCFAIRTEMVSAPA